MRVAGVCCLSTRRLSEAEPPIVPLPIHKKIGRDAQGTLSSDVLGLDLHRVSTLEARAGILRIGSNGASLHCLSPLETTHVVALHAVRTIRIVVLIITATLS